MLINNATRELIQKVDQYATIVAHDWLTYLLVSGCGGNVIYDTQPSLDYRQHDSNIIGANADFKNQISRVFRMLSGRFKEWTSQNLAILTAIKHNLTPENQQRLQYFELARKSNLLNRLKLMKKSGIYRQTIWGTITLKIAIIFNKI
ncbi:hypothetical protein D3C84_860580 [compost metagenome]